MRVALAQLSSSDDPDANLEATLSCLEKARGADLIVTPEVTNCVSLDRVHQRTVLKQEADDRTLAAVRAKAAEIGTWVSIGSLAVSSGDADGRFVNRSFLIAPDGSVAARYDKIHMFDVSLSQESFRESDGYRPGTESVLVDIGLTMLGLTICYDIRFPSVFRNLAQAGADVILAPLAFTVETGGAHLETLLRARAIETGSYVVAAAQTGTHHAKTGRRRETYGHSMVVDPWGNVLLDAGSDFGVFEIDLNLELVSQARHRIPVLEHGREFASAAWTKPTKT